MNKKMMDELRDSRILHWSYRNFEQFPEELMYYGKMVTDIYMKDNVISKLPVWISTMVNLSEIYLSGNKLRDLPEDVFQLKSLVSMDVSRNEITSLPHLSSSENLTVFTADNNDIRKLPKDIGKLKNLMILHLSGNKLKDIPDSLCLCRSLQELNLDDNKIIALPKALIYLPKLIYVSIRNNKIAHLPAMPFQSEPKILCSGNPASYITYAFAAYLLEYYSPVNEYGNILARRNEGMEPPSMGDILTERLDVIKLNFWWRIQKEASPFPATLLELTTRVLYPRIFRHTCTERYVVNVSLLESLPSLLRGHLENGPTAACEECGLFLFWETFAAVFIPAVPSIGDVRNASVKNVLCYFCSAPCASAFKIDIEKNLKMLPLVELTWNLFPFK